MKIGLIDIDGHNFPNLALMKISRYHRDIGDDVGWVNWFESYDRVYKSKVFTFTADDIHYVDAKEIMYGGTGYGLDNELPEYIDRVVPDYSLYPIYREAYGFLTRGCLRSCDWCVVPQKEGMIRGYMDIDDFRDGRGDIILMDNNVLAHRHGLDQIEKIVRLKLRVDFNQGLDARIISNDEGIAEMLGGVRWYKPLRMACDTRGQIEYIEKAVGLLRKHGAKPSAYFVYVLVKDIGDALERVEFLRGLGCDAFAQPYRDFRNGGKVGSLESVRFARWVNHKAIFKSVKWEDYNG